MPAFEKREWSKNNKSGHFREVQLHFSQDEHQQTLTNMYLTFLIIGVLLVPKADTLKCYDCMFYTKDCISTSERQCDAEFNRCGATAIKVFNGSLITPNAIKVKGCNKAKQCIQGSVNFGVYRFVATSRCCDSDLCNTQDAPDPQSPKNPNGKKCFHCDGQGDCTGTLNCEGDEDLCISALAPQGKQEMLKGCASKSLCTLEETENQHELGKVSCCQGDYCNSSGSTRASFLFLLTMLTSLLFLAN